MSWLNHPIGFIRYAAATALAALLTALLLWTGAGAVAAGMIYLVLVVWSATRANTRISFYLAFLCAILFDFFFLPPYRTLALAGGQEWIALFSLVFSSAVASRVAEVARREGQQAKRRQEDVERLYSLSQEMMLHENADGLLRQLPNMLKQIFVLDDVVLYIKSRDAFYADSSDLPQLVRATLIEMATGRASAMEMPDGHSIQGLMLGLSPVGAIGWRPNTVSRELAAAVCAQIAIAVTRALTVEASTRIEAARESERLRTALIDSLSHELRTPLTSIRAAATTLLYSNGLDDASRLDLTTIINEESDRLDQLIGEAVEMAEINADAVQVQLIPQLPRVLLERIIEESAKILDHHHVRIEACDTDKTVWLDAHLLRRVFRHLLENAARYCPQGSHILIHCQRHTDRLEFCVDDDGPGIDPVDLPLIFDKFYRGKRGTASGKGTGMGLAIVQALLRAHGGSIEVFSKPGEGSAFRFWIPLQEEKLTGDTGNKERD